MFNFIKKNFPQINKVTITHLDLIIIIRIKMTSQSAMQNILTFLFTYANLRITRRKQRKWSQRDTNQNTYHINIPLYASLYPIILITNEEITNGIELICKHIYNIVEMKGSIADKSRHIKLEFTSTSQCNMILQSERITVHEHIIQSSRISSSASSATVFKMQCSRIY